MKFQEFEKRIAKVVNLELPAEDAHYKMVSKERLQTLASNQVNKATAKRAGVMVLFYPSPDFETRFVLIHRKTYKGVHSNQVGFPGGKYEIEDLVLEKTALRETEEEVGVRASDITVLRSLSKVFIPPSNFFVFPYLGLLPYYPNFVRQQDEVEAVLEITLSDFMNDGILATKKVTTSYGNFVDVPAYLLNGFTVWGATAMMLSEVRELLKKVL